MPYFAPICTLKWRASGVTQKLDKLSIDTIYRFYYNKKEEREVFLSPLLVILI